MISVFLGLGSNKMYNDVKSIDILRSAYKCLNSIFQNIECSSVYFSEPMYVTDQDVFYNMVVRGDVEDSFTAFQLLDLIHKIEAKYGRDRSHEVRFGPRSLDIDIELFGNRVIDTVDLQIPHSRFLERKFVLVPLLELLYKSTDIENRKLCTTAVQQLSEQKVSLFMTANCFKSCLEMKNESKFAKSVKNSNG